MATGIADANGIQIAYETLGDEADPPVVLVMGLGAQLLGWPDEFCALLAARGHLVVRFDNRDAGLSTHLHDAPRPDPLAALRGDLSSAAYTLEDMADDTVGLLDALGLADAHLVGASMGGMIVQTVAIRHPGRVRSLTSIMSTTGGRDVGAATAEAARLLTLPPVRDRETKAERDVAGARTTGSPAYPADEDALRSHSRRAFDRSYDPRGVTRQLTAIFASGDRTPSLAGVRAPTLVIHGEDDPLVSVTGGRATAAAVPGAELLVFPGMGHDLPPALWGPILDAIAGLVRRADDARQRA